MARMTGIDISGEIDKPTHKSRAVMSVDKIITDDVLSLMY